MAKQTIKPHECACPAACKLFVPIFMIVVGVITLVRELTGRVSSEQEA